MSILSAINAQMAGKGRGFTKFPAGNNLVRLMDLGMSTENRDGQAVEFNWGNKDNPNRTPGVRINPKFAVIGADGEDDSDPMTIESMVFPIEGIPAEFMDAIEATKTYKKGESAPLPGAAWRFVIARDNLLSLLNVAMGLDPTEMIEDPDEAIQTVQDMLANQQFPEFQVTVEYKKSPDGKYENANTNFALAS